MKFGLQVIHAWSKEGEGVENPSQFLLELAVAADNAGWDGFFLWDHLLFPSRAREAVRKSQHTILLATVLYVWYWIFVRRPQLFSRYPCSDLL